MKWKVCLFGELAKFRNGLNFLRSDNGEEVRIVGVGDFQENFRISFEQLENVRISGKLKDDDLLRDNDLLFVRSNGNKSLVGRCILIEGVDARTSFSGFTIRARFVDSGIDPTFAGYYFQSGGAKRAISYAGGGTNISNLSQSILAELEVPVPPLPEQRKIADILTTWDEALARLDALIEAQERRKKALMQQLLTGKKRVPGFKGKWKRVSLSSVLQPISRPVAKPEGAFLAAGIRSHGKGVFLKPEFKPADIALEELFELKTGDLVVNITFAWEGAAAIVPPEADGALVSHRFPSFGFREGQAALSFFRHYIRTKRFVFDCGLASPGGAGRNRVLSKSAFLDIELLLPPFDEQEKIGAILDTADQQLTLLRTQRTALDQQKRGLMQRLLTGKIRVKPN